MMIKLVDKKQYKYTIKRKGDYNTEYICKPVYTPSPAVYIAVIYYILMASFIVVGGSVPLLIILLGALSFIPCYNKGLFIWVRDKKVSLPPSETYGFDIELDDEYFYGNPVTQELLSDYIEDPYRRSQNNMYWKMQFVGVTQEIAKMKKEEAKLALEGKKVDYAEDLRTARKLRNGEM